MFYLYSYTLLGKNYLYYMFFLFRMNIYNVFFYSANPINTSI